MEPETGINLLGGHRLSIAQGDGSARLQLLRGTDAVLEVQIDQTGGIALTVRGPSLSIVADELLRLEARRIELAALEGLALSAGGDISAAAGGEVAMAATDLRLIASPGRILMRANDDVSLDGERVLVNCDGVGRGEDYIYGRVVRPDVADPAPIRTTIPGG